MKAYFPTVAKAKKMLENQLLTVEARKHALEGAEIVKTMLEALVIELQEREAKGLPMDCFEEVDTSTKVEV